MKRIFKYQLLHGDFYLPKGSMIMKVENQHDSTRVWAVVDPNEQELEKIGEAFHTGDEITNVNLLHFQGTYIMHDGSYVLHFFCDRKNFLK